MGNRAVITFKAENDMTPAIYLHWGGSDVEALLNAAVPTMRDGDAGYSAARFCGYCCNQVSGNMSVGLLPNPDNDVNWQESSHGDAGVFIVDVHTWVVERQGNYRDELNGTTFKLNSRPPD